MRNAIIDELLKTAIAAQINRVYEEYERDFAEAIYTVYASHKTPDDTDCSCDYCTAINKVRRRCLDSK